MQPRNPNQRTPQQRLARFLKRCGLLLRGWSRNPGNGKPFVAIDAQELEPRVLYDASPLGAAFTEPIEPIDQKDYTPTADHDIDPLPEWALNPLDPQLWEPALPEAVNDPSSIELPNQPELELIAIDARVLSRDSLLEDLSAFDQGTNPVEVMVIDADSNGINAISERLKTHRNVSSIHLIAFQDLRGTHLGQADLNPESIPALTPTFSLWRQSLATDANVLLYGWWDSTGSAPLQLAEQTLLWSDPGFEETFALPSASQSESAGYQLLDDTARTSAQSLEHELEQLLGVTAELATGWLDHQPLSAAGDLWSEAVQQAELDEWNSLPTPQLMPQVSVADAAANEHRQLVFIDSQLPDLEQLISAWSLADGQFYTVVVLDSTGDGLQFISNYLANSGETFSAIHLLTHGFAGGLQLGSTTLTSGSLDLYADELASWQLNLTADADLLLYGCYIADGMGGQQFVADLARVTGRDVAASTDATGYSLLGGDWELEYQVGQLAQTSPLIRHLDPAWQHLLLTYTVRDEFTSAAYTNNNGTNSWIAGWSETDSGGAGATTGHFLITGGQLRLQPGNTANVLSRQANLTGAHSATLTFNFDSTLDDNASNSTITVDASSNGTTWTTLDTFTRTTNTVAGNKSYDLTSYISAQTSVRFTVTTANAGAFYLFVDNFQISYDINTAPTAVADTATAVEAGGVSNGTAGTNPTGNVLTNDTDADAGDTKTVTGVAAGVVGSASGNVGSSVTGSFGSISIAANGSYTYTVDNNNATVQALRTSGNTLTDTFTYTMRDALGLTSTTQITVTIQGANDAPSDITGTLTIAENSANGTAVGTVTGTDVDTGDTRTWSLTDSAGGRFAINSSTGQVTVANSSLLNFESATSHNITIRVTDTAGATFDKVLGVTISDVAETLTLTSGSDTFADTGVTETSINAGDGDDTIITSSGNDNLIGGNGTDTVSYETTPLYTEDFQSGATGWSSNTTESSANLTSFLGRFSGSGGAQAVSKTFSLPTNPTQSAVEFDLYRIYTWDNESFNVFINDSQVVSVNLHHAGTISATSGTTGNVSWTANSVSYVNSDFGNTQIIRFSLIVTSPGTSLKLGFGTTLDEHISNESYGIDNLSISTGSAVNVNLSTATAQNTGGSGNDTLQQFENLTGSSFNDTLTGDAGNNVLRGSGGSDTLTGALGHDTFNVDSGTDTITDLGVNDDQLIVAAGATANATAYGWFPTAATINNGTVNINAAGTNVNLAAVTGTSGWTITNSGNATAVTLVGSTNNDTITGGSGADTITGGGGSEMLTGGAGNDTFNVDSGTDYITDLGNGADILTVSAGTTAVVTASGNWTATASSANSGTASITVSGFNINVSAATGASGWTLTNSGNATAVTLTGSANADVITAGSGNDNLSGGNGNDTFTGGAGNDTIDGGVGTDTVMYSSAYSDYSLTWFAGGFTIVDLRGGSPDGTDTVTNVEAITFSNGTFTLNSGTNNNDTLTGTAANEYLAGFNLDDTINGGDGDDILDGGDGNDTLNGQNGNDILVGGLGTDILTGGAGNDTQIGGTGNDTFTVDAGTDTITDLGNGSDILVVSAGATANASAAGAWTATASTSNAGTATVTASGFNINVSSASGSSGWTLTNSGNATGVTLTGTDKADTLTGGSGNDTLVGSFGNDTLTGGAGNDTFTVASGTDTITDLGNGADIVNISAGATANATAAAAWTATASTSNAGTASVTASGFNINVSAAIGASGWTLTNSGNATGVALTGSANADVITGGSGNDTLEGRAGSDTLTGGLGTDTLAYDNSSASVRIDLSRSAAEGGEAAGDTYSGIENVRGSANADALFGDQNNNQIDGGVGNDLILGGVNLVNDSHFTAVTPAGSYTIYSAGQSFGGWTVTAGTVDLVKSYWDPPPTGGQSVDTSGTTVGTIEQTLTTVAGNTYELFFYMTSGLTGANTRSLTLNVGGQTQDFTVTTTSAHTYSTMEWTAQYYTFTATSSSTTISFTGQTTNWGAAIGAVVVTNMTAAQGTDILDGGSGDDTLMAGGGNDTLTGGSGNDTLMGGAGNDTFTGGAGNDFFKVDAGTDSITDLGNGSDILTVSSGATANATVAGAWTATASSSNSGTAVLTASGFNINVSATSGSSGWTLTNSGNTTAVTLTGSLRPDTLVGGTGADTLFGGGGNDLISGGDGNDTLNGASGIDTISGGMGDDTLIGGGENDTLTGDAGNDTFTVDFGTDTITDLGNGVDILNVSATATANATVAGNWSATSSTSNFGTVTINGLGSNVNVSAATGTSGWTLTNAGATYQDSVLTGSANNDILIGGGFIDTLVGGAGNDSLTGGAGNDSFTGGTGNDTFTIDSGSDTITDFGSGADILNVSAGATVNATAASGWTATASSSNAGTATISANGFNLNVSAATGASGWTLTNAGNSVAVTLTGSANTDTLIGGSGDDSLNAGGGDDLLVGGDGNDSIYGAAGTDYAVYSTATAGVNVNLALTTAQDTGGAGIDTLLSIEGVDGSNFNDTITGNASDNALWGRSGNDTLTGGGGNDSLLGGTGDDVAVFSGNWRDYTITTGSDANGTYYQLVDSTAARDGTDRIYDIESVQFADGTVSAGSLMNAPPIAAVDFATAVEAGGVSNGTAGTNPSGNVLTNDTDTNSLDTRTVTGVAAGSVGSASGNVGSSVNGTYGSISIAANGSYTYTVDNNNATVQALRTTGNTLTDTFTYTITDSWGLTSTTQVMVAIQGANDAPNDITGSLTVAEGSANGTAAGTVAGQDIDAGDSFSYSLIDTAGGRFAINSSTGQVTVANGSLLDFQTAASHNITVRVTDAMGATFDKVMTVAVTNSNDAPVLNTTFSPTLGSVLEGATNPSGITVASLVVDGSITDPDGSAVEAIAITGLNTSNGTWQYSLNGGTSWLTINAELINNQTNELALLLGPTAQLRLLPFGDLNGSLSNAITFRAWDQAIGSEGQYTVITSTGGSSPFSTASDSATITVMAVNDAPTFAPVAGTGKLLVPVGSGTDYAQSLTVQPDGRILVAGTSWNGTDYDFSLIRLNADGSLDTTFDTDGKLLVPVGYSDTTQSITVQPDGRIVVGGYSHDFNNVEFSLIRLNADGSLDTTFDTDGKLLVPVGYGNDYGYSVIVQPDGRILLAGLASNGNDNDFSLIRLNPDGSLDTTFDTDGKLLVPVDSSDDFGYSVAVQPDGRILVAGNSWNGSDYDFSLIRLNADGSLDTTFDTDGKLLVPVDSSDDFGYCVAVQPDGRILVAGNSWNGSDYDFSLIRLNADGALDTTFDTDGKLLMPVTSSDDRGRSVTVQPDGRILVAGNSWNGSNDDFSLIRLNADGSLDTTFDTDGKLLVPVGYGNDYGYSVVVQPDGRILLAGLASNGNDYDFGLIRLNADGSLDTTFNGTATNTLGGSVSYTENGSPVVLDGNACIFDADLSATNFSGATLTLVRNGAANSQDLFSATGTLGTLTQGSSLTVAGTTIGTITTNSGGTLVLTFNSSATNALVNSAIQQIAFANSSDTPSTSVQIDWTFSDGNSGAQGTGGALTATGNIVVNITAVNDAPVATNDTFTTSEDTPVTFDVRTNDSDVDGPSLSVTQINGSAISIGGSVAVTGGSVKLNANGTLTFTPTDNYNGSPSFTYTVSDGGLTATATVNGTVTAINDAPTFVIGDGIVTTEIGEGDDEGWAVVMQSDGKIVLAGRAMIGSGFDFALVRYNANGSLDSSFGTGGRVITSFGGGFDAGLCAAIQPDGKILVAGVATVGSNTDVALVRYNTDGSLDTSFGTGGKVTTAINVGSSSTGYGITLQSDGKVIVAGSAGNGSNDDFALVRYNANGTLDTSFGGGDGIVTTAIGTTGEYARSVTLQPDGKIVLGGYSEIGGNFDFALVRYNPDGSLDSSFGTGGKVTTAIGTGMDIGQSVTLQPDGKIVVGGGSLMGSNLDFALVRYNADGSLDTTFGTGGKVTTALSASVDQGNSVTIQSDGKIVVGGTALIGSTEGFALVRYNADGSLDNSFGAGGKVTTTIGSGWAKGLSVTLQSDGRLVVGGIATSGGTRDFALVRYNADGSLDLTFDQAGATLGGAVSYTENGSPVVLDSDVRIFDAELSSSSFNGATLTLVRNGGANSEDLFSSTGALTTLTQGGNLVVEGVTIGTVTTNSNGMLVLTFNSNASNALVNSALQKICYSNSSGTPPASVQINWTFNDGNSGAQGTGGAYTVNGNVVVNISSTNDAPILNSTASPTLSNVLEGAVNPSGVTVAALVVDGSITDPDGSAVEAIAITGLNTSLGTWQYSLDGGTSWQTIDATQLNSNTNELALLLGPTAQLRLIPFGDLNGSVNDAITFRAWDQSSGSEGQYTVITATGGASAFSTASDTASITVTAVNDAPMFLIGDGIVTTDIGTSTDQGTSVAVQPDGKIVVAGVAWIGSTFDFALVRYNVDGTLDTSFGTGGIVTTDLGTANDVGYSLTIQPDGKMVVGGWASNGSNDDFALVRYNVDGTLDTAFGIGGMVTTDIGIGDNSAWSVTLQADGKIVLAGAANLGSGDDFTLVRYNVDGTLDTSFGSGGIVTTDIGTYNDLGWSVTVQPNGKIVLAGVANLSGGDDFALVRYEADGSLDYSFGTDGVVMTDIGTGNNQGWSVTVQPDGKIVVAGCAWIGSNFDFALVRYDVDGSLDTSFGTGGIVTTDIGTYFDQGFSVTVQPDGKLVVAGYANISGDNDFALVRYNPDGTPDTTFGTDGIVMTDIGTGYDFGWSVTVQTDGKIVVSGYSTIGGADDFTVVRYNADGSLDTTFDLASTLGGSVSYTENGSPVVLDSDVQIFDVELSSSNFSGATLTLVRNGGANGEDLFSATGTLGALTQGGNLVVDGTTIGSVTSNSGGSLVLTFNSSATNALVNLAMQQIAYANSSTAPPSSVEINWTFSDGNSGDQGIGGALTATGSVTVNISGANDAPTAVADSANAVEAGGIGNGSAGSDPTGNVLANDTDPDAGDSQTVIGVEPGTVASASGSVGIYVAGNYGQIHIGSNGDYIYLVDNGNVAVQALRTSGQTLTDTFTYTMEDAEGLTSSTQITITISGANDAPNDITGTLTVSESAANGASVGIVTGEDADSGETLTYQLIDSAGGRFAINSSTGEVTVANSSLLDYETNSTHQVTIRVTDLAGASYETTLTVNVTDDNEASIAVADSATAVEAGGVNNGTAGSNPTGNVLTNDADPDAGDTKTVTGVAAGTVGSAAGNVGSSVSGTYGSITIAADGSYTYTVDNTNAAVQALRTSANTLIDTFTYTMQDAGGLTSTTQVAVTIQGTNDAPHDLAGTLTVAENAANGSTTGTITRSDVDSGDGATYSLVDDAGGRFAINSSTGAVTVANSTLLNYEAATSHNITVRVTDTAGATFDKVMTVTLTDVDEFDVGPVTDINPASNNVNENAVVGTVVGITASASDADATNNTITYSLEGSASGRFAVDSSTGVVTVSGALDYETSTSHNITVRATSSDGSFSTQVFTIQVNDVNEGAIGSVADANGAANFVLENSSNGTLVGLTGLATDPDGSDTVSYSLDDSAGGRFAINSSTGVVTVAGGIDRETAGSYNIIVRATSSDTSFSTQSFTITIGDVDEFDVGTVSDSNASSNNVNENAVAGTTVGITASASDADATTNTIAYTLTNSDGGRFAIDSSTGVVTVAGAIDREADGATRSITVRATSADGSFTDQIFTIAINDLDEFDITPVVDVNAAANSLAENSANGTLVGITASASDQDGTSNTVNYSLDDNAGGRFTVNSSTGVVTVADSSLLNFEAATSHNITIRATSADGSFSTQSFTINLTDVDEFDVTPVVDVNAAANSLAENSANGTAVGITASASDQDGTTNTINYSLDDNAGGRFTVNSSTGVVTVADGSLLNFEAATSHSITIRATSADGSFSTQSFTINLTDVDEFDVTPVVDLNAAANSLAENSVNGTLVGITASASDQDGTTNTINYSLDDNAGGRFAVNSSTGVVTVADGSLLNYEAATSHNITIRATSADGSFSTQSFTINLTDVDEFDVGAVSDVNAASNNVNENAAIGTTVGITASGSDADATNNTINYSLTDNDGGRFAINSSTGVVTVAGAIDREADGGTRSITVRATSADGSFTDQVFTIAINDVDEFDVNAVIDANATSNNVNEEVVVGTTVGITASASDADATTNTITFSLDDSAGGRFAVDSSTGVVTVAGAIDYETSTSHSITVRATSADGSFSTQVFTIQVNDVNEGAVGPVTDSNAAANFVIENSSNGTLVGLTGLATDPDGSDTVSYSLDDSAGGRFAINSSTGVVTVAGGIDREAAGSYNITIRATSSDASFSTQSFTITIGDVDEFDVTPVVDVNAAANSLAENSANGTLVGITASAMDQDGTTNTINYSLDDNAGGRFAIDPSTGVVSVANSSLLNYEATTSHSITIRATSADGSVTTQSFMINLTDVDEYDVSAVSDINPAANSVAENAAAGTTVGLTAFAADSDSTNNAITYTLTDDDGGRFAINSSTGAVSTTRGLDRELDGAVRQVTIRATSADGSWSEQTFTIDIQDQDEFDVTIPADVNSSPNFIAENSAAGSLVGITAQASDTDATTNLVTYSLSNNDGGRFAIDPVSGVVTTTRTLDREFDGAQRQVTVRATSADGSFAEQNFTIDIGDLDEFDVTAPADVNAASNFVAENSATGSLVGITAQAADSDSTNNLITYSLSNDDGGRFAIDPVSGVVTTTRALDREIDGASRQITIRSTSADGSTAEQVFIVSIGDIDEADVTVPVDANPSANQVAENAAIGSAVGLTISAHDSDATQSIVSYQLLDSAGGRFAIDALTGVVTVAGPLDYETATTHTILVRATSQDGSAANQSFTINVLPLNDNTPQMVTPTSYTVGENQLNIGFVGGTDADLPGPALSYTISGGADAAKFVLDPISGQLQFVGLQDFEAPSDSNTNGVYEVRIRVSDGQLWSEQLVQVTVADENDQPVVISDNWSMDEDTTLNQSVLANDSDQDADPLTVELLEGPENAANFALNSDGTFNYRPAENWYGTDGFRYRISDGRGGTSEGNVTLQVQPVNDAPISLENVFTVLQGSTLETATGVLNNDMDIESEPLIAILVAPPTRGVITFRVDGSFLYKPEIGFIGTDNFTYIASDGVMAGTPTTVWVQVDVGSGLPSTPPPPPAPFGDSGNSGGNSSGDSGSSSGDSSSGSGNSDTGNSDSSSNNDSSGGDNSNTNTAGTDSTDATPQAGQTQTGTTGVSGDDEQLAAGSEDRQLEGGSAIRLEDLQADVLTGEERLIGSFRIRDFIAAQTAIGDGEEVDTSRIEVNGKMIEVSFNRRQLWEQLAYLQRQVEEKRSLQSDSSLGEIALEIGTATMAASLGYVLWFLRGSAMMATAITQIPSWKMIDPLVILDSRNTTQDSTYEDQDIINSYFENASND